ncbi:hypothetical protein BDR04DRAFT_1087291 [Suillus decipiens]|nr:hypothetical protein BDR04DRAFT_1087291 [Suillus decipiens]
MASILRLYNAAIIRRPVFTHSTTSAVLFGAGDVIAQQIIERRGKNHDFMRTARLTFYGGALFGPAFTKWFQLLNRIKFSSPTKAVIGRVAMDQAIMVPVMVGLFFSTVSILEGKGISGVQDRLSTAYAPAVLLNWGIFIPTQLINFAIVPHHLRFVVVNFVSLFRNAYLSVINTSSQHLEAIESDKDSEK